MDSKLRKLDELEALWKRCGACALSIQRTRVVMWRGSPDGKLFIIGDGPGVDEDAKGLPFVGSAGQRLDELAALAGIDMNSEAFVANMVGCRPPGDREPSREEVRACRPRLEAFLAIVQPKVLVLLGGTAANLAGITSITRWRGTPTEVEMVMPDSTIKTWKAVPTFHPSCLVGNGDIEEMRQQIVGDFKKAMEMAYG